MNPRRAMRRRTSSASHFRPPWTTACRIAQSAARPMPNPIVVGANASVFMLVAVAWCDHGACGAAWHPPRQVGRARRLPAWFVRAVLHPSRRPIMSDKTILQHITELVEEEKRLRAETKRLGDHTLRIQHIE